MAHVKGAGTTALGRDSQAQRLGVKLFEGEKAKPGSIIIRQHGTKFHTGKNVKRAKDDSIFAVKAGKIHFSRRKVKKFNGQLKLTNFVSVV